jgi:hypothetical protein
MPTVPRLDRPQVATAPLPTPQTTPMAEGGAVASAALGAGARLAGGITEIVQQERRKAQVIQANEAEVQLRRMRDQLLYDSGKGALSKRGLNARTAPEEFGAEWTRAEGEILQRLSDPEVRENVRLRALATRAEAEGIILRHIDGEIDKVDEQTTDALIADEMAAVVRTPSDAARVAESITGATTLMRQRLERMGVPPEAVKEKVVRLASEARLRQVDALVRADEVDAADAVFAEFRDVMTPDDARKAQALVEDGGIRVRSQRATDAIFAQFGKDDERGALAKARGDYEGKMRDEVVRRVEMRYADERRLFNQDVVDNVNTALNAVEQGGEIPVKQRDWLLTNAPDKLNQLRRRQRQVKNGTAVETDWDVYEELFNRMTNAELAKVNPADYRADLSNTDYKTLVNRVAMLNQTGGRGDGKMSPGQVTSELLQRSRAMGLIGGRITSLSELNKTPAIKTRFNALSDAVTAALQDREAAEGRPLTGTEQRAVLQSVLDDQVMTQGGFPGFRRDIQVRPRAFVGPNVSTRELTPEERGANRLPEAPPGVDPEEWMEYLRERGFVRGR